MCRQQRYRHPDRLCTERTAGAVARRPAHNLEHERLIQLVHHFIHIAAESQQVGEHIFPHRDQLILHVYDTASLI